jgi:hypothetical protein
VHLSFIPCHIAIRCSSFILVSPYLFRCLICHLRIRVDIWESLSTDLWRRPRRCHNFLNSYTSPKLSNLCMAFYRSWSCALPLYLYHIDIRGYAKPIIYFTVGIEGYISIKYTPQNPLK